MLHRQRLYRTPAITLKRMDLGEADRILTLYTRDHGKVRAVARGVRRITSRSAGHLEPFTLADVLLARGRELDVISQADTLHAYRQVRESLERTTHAYYLAEVTDLLTEERLENRVVFDALAAAYEALDTGMDERLVAVAYLLRTLQALGYRPELVECLVCRGAIQPGRNQFSPALGGVLCPGCGPAQASARPLGDPALKLLRHVQRTDGQHYVNAPMAASREADQALRDYAEHVVERRLRSPRLIAQVQQAALD